MQEAINKGEKYIEEELPSEFHYHMTNSSCYFDQIQGILFGGTSSRFWLYRKHMISIDYDRINFDNQNDRKNVFPFFAW